VGIGESWQNPEKFYKVNYLTTLNLLKIARKNCAAFVQISSYVYGEPEYQPIDELHIIKAYNPYASSKIFSEKLCIDYSKNFQIPVTILRPFNIYGLEQSSNFLIAQLIKSAKNKSSVEIFDMDAKRDYLWIDDLASGILKVINNNHEGLKIYNIGSGKSYSAREIVNIISDYIPNFNNYVISSNQKILIQDCICDNSLFSHDYGWKPSITIENGIEKIIKNIN
jgi:nucleoside-diphosphate-sugar epimerase